MTMLESKINGFNMNQLTNKIIPDGSKCLHTKTVVHRIEIKHMRSPCFGSTGPDSLHRIAPNETIESLNRRLCLKLPL